MAALASASSSALTSPPISSAASMTTGTSTTFSFPPHTHFPPFYTLQPNLSTRARQLELWSTLITDYAAHHRLFRLSLSSPPADLFDNSSLRRRLKAADVRAVLDYMADPANGTRVEWTPPAIRGVPSDAVYVWWRSAGEWAERVYGWVEETGQKGAVLTVYELREGEGVRDREWREMDEGMLRKVLGALVKRGKAQMFGSEGADGVKFF